MKRRGVTIVAILLMLVVLAAVIGAMVIAGSGTIGGEFVSARAEEARRAAEGGAQRALGILNHGTPPPAWLFTAGPGPIPWQAMDHGDAEFQVYHVPGNAANFTFVNTGDPANNILPSSSTVAPGPNTVAKIPKDVNLHFLLSVGRTHSGQYRQVGIMYTTAPSFTVLSQQVL
jgi:hypothetical protein